MSGSAKFPSPTQNCGASFVTATERPNHRLKPPRLIDLYNSYFEIKRVETAEELAAVFRLRYEVYCVENAFEDPADNPHGFETDGFDDGSLHSLLLRREDQEVIGAVRLILPLARCGMEGTGLPIRDVCQHRLVESNNTTLPWDSTAEISRFAVSKKLRRRSTDGRAAGGELPPPNDPYRRLPDTSLGLMQAVIEMASATSVTHLCAVMEPTLLRMLRRLGMDFPSLGPEVEYHGRRQPCYAELDSGLAKTWLKRRDVWEFLTRDGSLWPLNTDLVNWFRKPTYSVNTTTVLQEAV